MRPPARGDCRRRASRARVVESRLHRTSTRGRRFRLAKNSKVPRGVADLAHTSKHRGLHRLHHEPSGEHRRCYHAYRGTRSRRPGPIPRFPAGAGTTRAPRSLRPPRRSRTGFFRVRGSKTQETPRQRHDRGTLHGRPPFLTSTLPADPRFSAPQNPARVVGSGYIQFPPQRPFAGPLLTQPPTVSVRDPRSAKRSASKSRSLSRNASTPSL